MIENHKKKVLNAIAVLEKRNFPEIDELLNSVGACYDKATSLLDDYFDEHSVLTLINDTWNSDLPEDFLDELQNEYYGAAEPPVRCGESHLSGLTEPPHFIY